MPLKKLRHPVAVCRLNRTLATPERCACCRRVRDKLRCPHRGVFDMYRLEECVGCGERWLMLISSAEPQVVEDEERSLLLCPECRKRYEERHGKKVGVTEVFEMRKDEKTVKELAKAL